jgi:hypothetical protein
MSDDDEHYAALLTELEDLAAQYAGPVVDPNDLLAPAGLWNEPEIAIRILLYRDAIAEAALPDAVVERLWQIGYELGADAELLMPRSTLADARPGRRTRPPEPVRYPLKGGGHGPGRGIPGKTEFPARWSDADTTEAFMSVATEPGGAVQQPDGTFRAWGVRDGVDLRVIVTELGHVQSAYPVAGEGVVTNPLDDLRRPYVERLQALADAAPLNNDARAGVAELMAVGEWDQVVLHLRAVMASEELDALAASAGL